MDFKPVGNMGCRTWWGTGTLLDRDLGGYSGGWLFGVNGPRPGKYDTEFVKWCVKHRFLYVRTVDLFWAFEYHREGFPKRLDVPGLHQRWRDKKWERRNIESRISRGKWKPGVDPPVCHVAQKVSPKRWRYYDRIITPREYLNSHPDPGYWKNYRRRMNKYFRTELGRYRHVIKFWLHCGEQVRRSFLRCARFSNRRPESHPDYLVVSRRSHGSGLDFGFVEVKGPRESLRPSQRRFFPELVRHASQKVWLARFTMHGRGIRFARFAATGQLTACDTHLATSTSN
jgi:hypothetical protein